MHACFRHISSLVALPSKRKMPAVITATPDYVRAWAIAFHASMLLTLFLFHIAISSPEWSRRTSLWLDAAPLPQRFRACPASDTEVLGYVIDLFWIKILFSILYYTSLSFTSCGLVFVSHQVSQSIASA